MNNPIESITIDAHSLCRECGTMSIIDGYVNRIPSDLDLETKSGIALSLDLYICGPCNDIFEGCEASQDWKTYEKEIDEWIKDVDKKFPDAKKFRAYVYKGTKSKLTDKDVGDLLALIKNYSNPGNEGPADLNLAFNDPEAYQKQKNKEER